MLINMKRQLGETELDRAQAENERLKDKIKLYILERTYLQKRQESDESERKLTMERFKQKLAKVENEKRELTLEYQRLCRGLGLGQCSDLWFSSYDFFTGEADIKYNPMLKSGIVKARNRVPSRRVKIEPRVVLDDKFLNHTKAKLRDYRYVKRSTKNRKLNSSTRMKLKYYRCSQEYPSPKDPGFKQELVLTALRAIGGKGTLDDVDKWVRKHHSQLYGNGLNRRVLSRALSRQADSKVLDVERRTKKRRWNIYRIPAMIPCVPPGAPGQSKPSAIRMDKTTGDTRDIPHRNGLSVAVSNHAQKAAPMWTTSLIAPTNNKQSPSASIVRRAPQSLMNIPGTNVITASLSATALSSQDKLSLENIPQLIAEETPAQNPSPLTQVA